MSEEEAIQILIANGVCSTPSLHCDEDCPFYNEKYGEENKISCNAEAEFKIYEAVKVLNKKYNKCK